MTVFTMVTLVDTFSRNQHQVGAAFSTTNYHKLKVCGTCIAMGTVSPNDNNGW